MFILNLFYFLIVFWSSQGYLVSLKPICLSLGSEWSLWPHLQKTDVLTTQMMSLAIPEPLQPLVLTGGQVVITPHQPESLLFHV